MIVADIGRKRRKADRFLVRLWRRSHQSHFCKVRDRVEDEARQSALIRLLIGKSVTDGLSGGEQEYLNSMLGGKDA